MTDVDLAEKRMAAAGLAGPSWADAHDVVRRFGAVQSQEFGPALWSLRQRLSSGSEGALLAEFDAGTILRTHVLRPTWHFVLPADIRWLLTLTAPRVHAFNRYYYRKYELDDDVLARCRGLIERAVAARGPLTRAELAAVLRVGGIVADGLRLGLILMHAELEQLTCSGPRRGKQHTYALLDERVPESPATSVDEALAELTARYFASHGPATAKDFAWWSSLTMAQCRHGIELAAGRLESAIVDGVAYWVGESAPGAVAPAVSVQLLQPYDEYVVAYSESKHVVDRAGWGALRPELGGYIGIVIRDGQLAGFWKRTVKRADVTVDVQLYEPFDAMAMAALRAAVDDHARFLGRSGVLAEPALISS
jgi:Winged helix DNA-binding domain